MTTKDTQSPTTPTASPASIEAQLNCYSPIGLIGNGAFGKVHKIVRKHDQKVLVWKEIHYGQMSDKEKELIVSEVNIIKSLRNPYIVRYYDRIIDKEGKKIYIIMEYCPGGDLAAQIRQFAKEGKSLDEDKIWRMLCQLCIALGDCHNRKEGKIIHRDLKPANIFLVNSHAVKLGDFGLARILSEHSKFAHTNVGTPFYMSPEQISEAAYNEKSDIWSLGCVLYELCNLVPPFQASNHLQLAMKIKDGNFAPVSSRYSSELRTLISRMLTVDPNKRIGIDEILKMSQVSVRLLQIQLNEQAAALKRKEEELKARELLLEERERLLVLREQEVKKREKVSGASNIIAPPSSIKKPELKKYDESNKENKSSIMFKNFKVPNI